MEIKDPQTFDSMLATAEVDLDPKEVLRWVAMPGGSPSGRQVSAIDRATPATLHVMVGPEGGLTDDENQRLVESGWIPVGLGERILRIETAAVAIASMVLID